MDEDRDFTKDTRENLMVESLPFAGKKSSVSLVFPVSLNEEDRCGTPARSIIRRTKEHFG